MINKYLSTAAFSLLMAISLSSCTYSDVMNDRQSENDRLQGAYAAEQRRADSLRK